MREITELRGAFERRWRNIVEKGNKFGKGIPDKKELWSKVLRSYNNSFTCPYCGQGLMIKDSVPPYSRSFSLDHRVSLWLGGDNSVGNIAIVCTRCNQIKGTMTDTTFKKVINAILRLYGNELLEEMFKEIYAGRFADKLSREENLKNNNRK